MPIVSKPAAFLGSPLPLPAQPSILAAQDAREGGGGEQGGGSKLVLLTCLLYTNDAADD